MIDQEDKEDSVVNNSTLFVSDNGRTGKMITLVIALAYVLVSGYLLPIREQL